MERSNNLEQAEEILQSSNLPEHETLSQNENPIQNIISLQTHSINPTIIQSSLPSPIILENYLNIASQAYASPILLPSNLNNSDSESESSSEISDPQQHVPINHIQNRPIPEYTKLIRVSVHTFCNRCDDNVTTNIKLVKGFAVWMAFYLIFIILPFLSWIPFYVNSWYDVEHYCSKCSRHLGTCYCKPCLDE